MEDKDTIELIDYLRGVWKRKWFIILFTIVCSTIAGIISFSMPKIYKASMVIEPGVFDVGSDGKFVYLDLPSNLRSKIDSQAYNRKICKKLNADPKKLSFKFKTIQPKGSNTITINLEAIDTNKSIQVLSALLDELTKEYQNYIDSRKSQFDQKITMNKRQLDISAGEKRYLEKEIAIVRANTDGIIEERNMLLKKGGDNPDKLSLLIYTNIIQQNMAHYDNLNRQLSELKNKIEKLKSEMETARIKKESIESIKLIQSPQSSIYPIKPKKKLIVILVGNVGLFISIILAFFLEYLQIMGIHPKSSTTRDQTPSVKNQQQ